MSLKEKQVTGIKTGHKFFHNRHFPLPRCWTLPQLPAPSDGLVWGVESGETDLTCPVGLARSCDPASPTVDGPNIQTPQSMTVTNPRPPKVSVEHGFVEFVLLRMASNLLAMASTLVAMTSNLLAMANNLLGMAFRMASNLVAMAFTYYSDGLQRTCDGLQPNSDGLRSNLRAMASNLVGMTSNLLAMALQLTSGGLHPSSAMACNLLAITQYLQGCFAFGTLGP